MTLTRWSPVAGLATLEVDRLNRMFESMFGTEAGGAWAPAVDIYETKEHEVVIKADLPDVKREDIRVTVDNNILTIEGERKFERAVTEAESRYHRQERVSGAFRRTFTLPSSLDSSKIEAGYQDGVLTVRLQERPEAKPRQVAIG